MVDMVPFKMGAAQIGPYLHHTDLPLCVVGVCLAEGDSSYSMSLNQCSNTAAVGLLYRLPQEVNVTHIAQYNISCDTQCM